MSIVGKIFQLQNYDLYIVFGLIGIVIVVFLVSRMGILPKKSLPYLGIALLGIFVIGLFRKMRTDGLKEKYKKAKADAEKTKKELEKMEKDYQISKKKRDEIIAEHEKRIAATGKHILMNEAENKARKREIEHLSGEELNKEVNALLDRL